MPLRIACDLDGTIADMDAALQQQAERLFGPGVELRREGPSVAARMARRAPDVHGASLIPVPAVDDTLPTRRPLTSTEMRRLWLQIRRIEDFWTLLPEIEPGAVARLGALAIEHRWEVLFVTQRPATAGANAQRQSQRWLQAHGFDSPAVFVVPGGSRGRVADSLGLHVVIDDRPEHCIDVRADSDAQALLVWRQRPVPAPASATRMGVIVVDSATGAFERLEEMTRQVQRPRGFMARLRNAVGV